MIIFDSHTLKKRPFEKETLKSALIFHFFESGKPVFDSHTLSEILKISGKIRKMGCQKSGKIRKMGCQKSGKSPVKNQEMACSKTAGNPGLVNKWSL